MTSGSPRATAAAAIRKKIRILPRVMLAPKSLLPVVFYAEQARRPDKKKDQKEPINNRFRPGGGHELRSDRFDHADDNAAENRASDAPEPPKHHDDEAFDVKKDSHRGKDVEKGNDRNPGDPGGRGSDPESDIVDRVLPDPHQARRFPVEARGPEC